MTPNLRAFLQVVRACEGTAAAEGYRALFGWAPGRTEFLFSSFADHPRVRTYETHDEFIRNGKLDYTTAAGAYQITASTWDDFTSAVGPRDFSPANQDECAAWLIERAGAMSDVTVGDLETALSKCGRTWASLPGSPYGQPTKSLAYCQTVFARAVDEAIATPETQPAAPIEDRSTPARPQDQPTAPEAPMFPLLIPLLTSLATVFTPLLQQKLTKALDVKDPTTANTMATQLMDVVKAVAAGSLPPTTMPDGSPPIPVDPARIAPELAVGLVKSSPALIAQVEQTFTERLAVIMPAIDRIEQMEQTAWKASEDSADRAAARAKVDDTPDQDRLLTLSLVIKTGVILASLAVGIITLGVLGKPYGELLTLFAAGVGMVWNKYGTRVDYRYGSSAQSKAKDVLIAEMSRK